MWVAKIMVYSGTCRHSYLRLSIQGQLAWQVYYKRLIEDIGNNHITTTRQLRFFNPVKQITLCHKLSVPGCCVGRGNLVHIVFMSTVVGFRRICKSPCYEIGLCESLPCGTNAISWLDTLSQSVLQHSTLQDKIQ